MPTTPAGKCQVSYTVFGDGTIETKLMYDPVEGLPDMPEFGMMFQFNADYDNLTWYGMGSEETYADRRHGAKLGIYSNKVADNMAKYLVPQGMWQQSRCAICAHCGCKRQGNDV